MIEAAEAAMHERASVVEVLALHAEGRITFTEMLVIVFEACYDQPRLRDDLVRRLREYPVDSDARSLGDEASRLARYDARVEEGKVRIGAKYDAEARVFPERTLTPEKGLKAAEAAAKSEPKTRGLGWTRNVSFAS